ncbi:MAG: formate dehydrogenase, partial [Saprospiraceae bacterium]|nr:formate dehydrogenase [Saprospiraceae bacterium]
MKKPKRTLIERIAENLRIIPRLDGQTENGPPAGPPGDQLRRFPPIEKWDDWVEYEATSWPEPSKKHYTIVPTTCFNCESACGLTAYIDKEEFQIRKFEGNP